MEDGKGECCIARWGGGHTAAVTVSTAEDYCNTSKMDMIMLKFRPIAPKPVAAGTTTATASESGSSQGNGSGRHAKAGGRGRKKTNSNCSSMNINRKYNHNNNNNNNNNNGRKRKSSSPDRINDYSAGNPNLQGYQQDYNDSNRGDPTLLSLFPEAPDLSPTGQDQVHNVMPFWHNINFYNNNNNNNNNNNDDGYTRGSSPSFDGNFNNCHVSSWW